MVIAAKISRPSRQPEPWQAVEPYVHAIGGDLALELFLNFGGSALYVSERPRPGSRLVAVIGEAAALALFREFGAGHLNVPLANAWLAHRLAMRGVSRSDIARRLRVARESVRGYLAGYDRGGGAAISMVTAP